jgi:hypothetical protein
VKPALPVAVIKSGLQFCAIAEVEIVTVLSATTIVKTTRSSILDSVDVEMRLQEHLGW